MNAHSLSTGIAIAASQASAVSTDDRHQPKVKSALPSRFHRVCNDYLWRGATQADGYFE